MSVDFILYTLLFYTSTHLSMERVDISNFMVQFYIIGYIEVTFSCCIMYHERITFAFYKTTRESKT